MEQRAQILEGLRPCIERAGGFSGWDLSSVMPKPLAAGPPWDYETLARERARRAESILDMGTGGGELLSRVVEALRRDGSHAQVTATEEWEVNAPVAKQRLAPLGIAVVRCKSLQLPFQDAAFDLILNRHEELDPAEVARVLRRGGCLVTQQVGSNEWRELRPFFPHKQEFSDHYEAYSRGFRAAGMAVTRQIHERKVAYRSLGDVVFVLLVAPWTIPGFDPERELDALLALEQACGTADGIVLTEIRYLMVAEKAA